MDDKEYAYSPYNRCYNDPDLYILQVNPEIRIRLDARHQDHGCLFREENGKWVNFERLTGWDLGAAYDQVSDMMIRDGSYVPPVPKISSFKKIVNSIVERISKIDFPPSRHGPGF